MNITMNYKEITTVEDIIRLNTITDIDTFSISSAKEKYEFVGFILTRIKYRIPKKKQRGIVSSFLMKVTSYSRVQLKRLIAVWKKKGLLALDHRSGGRHHVLYTPADIALLIQTDILHETRNGLVTKEHLLREWKAGKEEYLVISQVSVSHIYNIRKHNLQYRSSGALKYTKTRAVSSDIGERKKPYPEGKPGYIRVDSVHQGDLDGVKGLYHINLVDEVTQWELIGCVPQITDEYMEPLIVRLLDTFPFVVLNFHSDNGGEYINCTVARILERLLITQSKSRSRKSTDNALVEGKNGAVIRKHMGRNFIAKSNAVCVDEFYQQHFNIYLNYHRVCLYATEYIDKRGKIRKKYDQAFVPYERFKSLPASEIYLKEGITFAELDKIAYACSDNECAETMQKAKSLLTKLIKNTDFAQK